MVVIVDELIGWGWGTNEVPNSKDIRHKHFINTQTAEDSGLQGCLR